jgi:hypothetical protein
MQLNFFVIPVMTAQAAQDEIDRFCAGQGVDRHLIDAGRSSCWAWCVKVELDARALPHALQTPEHRANSAKAAIDYRQVLSEAGFTFFAGCRKRTAEHERGVWMYASNAPRRAALHRWAPRG